MTMTVQTNVYLNRVLCVLCRRVIGCPQSSEECHDFRRTNNASPATSSTDKGMRYTAVYHICWHTAVSTKGLLVDTVG